MLCYYHFVLLFFPRDYAKGSNTATPRGAWLRLVKDAVGVSDVKEAILMLEETLRGLQEGEDKMEGGRMGEAENRLPSVVFVLEAVVCRGWSCFGCRRLAPAVWCARLLHVVPYVLEVFLDLRLPQM